MNHYLVTDHFQTKFLQASPCAAKLVTIDSTTGGCSKANFTPREAVGELFSRQATGE